MPSAEVMRRCVPSTPVHYEPFAVLLPDVLICNEESRDKTYSFAAMVNALDVTGVG